MNRLTILLVVLCLGAFPAWASHVPGADNGRHLPGQYPTDIDASHAMEITGSVAIKATPEIVAAFLLHLDRHFLEINPDNLSIKVVGDGDLALGSEFITQQKADGRLVRSRFKVVEADGVSRMTLVSDPSVSMIESDEHLTTSITVYNIEPQKDGTVLLSQRLTLCFGSFFERLGAQAIGVKKTWQAHTDSSLLKIARMIEEGAR